MTTAAPLRTAFDDAGYTLDNIVGRLGPHAFAHLSGGEFAPLAYATRWLDRLDVLVRLFLVGIPVPYPLAAAALSPLAVEGWAARQLIEVDGDEVRGSVLVRPLGDPGDHLVVHDRPGPPGSLPADHVLGVSASTTALPGRRSVDRSVPPSTSAPAAGCKPCTPPPTAIGWSRPTSTRVRSPWRR